MSSSGQQREQRPSRGRDDVPFGEYLVILLDEWRTLIAPIAIVIVIAVIYLVLAVPRYVATGIIQVSTSEAGGIGNLLEIGDLGRPSPVQTEVEILRSRHIVGNAARKLSLHLRQEVPEVTLDLGISLKGASPLHPDLRALRKSVGDLEVADWVEQPIPAVFRATEGGGLAVALGDEDEVSISPGGRLERRGVTLVAASPRALREGTSVDVSIVPDDLLAASLLKRLSVESVGGRKDTNLVRISFEHPDRTTARDMVNAVMEDYMGFALEWRTLRADRSASFIEKQLEAIRNTLETSEHDLQEFLEKTGAVLLPDQAKELIRTGSELELDLRKVRIQEDLLSKVSAEIARANATGGAAPLTGDFLFDDRLLGDAIGALNELELKRQTLLSDMTETHPDVSRLGEEIRRVREQVLDLVRSSRDRVSERRRAIGRALDDIQSELAGFPDKERQMASLRRKLDVSQQLYTFLMTKLEESRILKASTTTDKRIIDRATTPNRKDKPKQVTTLALAAVLGLFLGVIAVYLRRAIDPRIRDEEEAKALTGLPVYGVIPDLSTIGLGKGVPSIAEVWATPKGPAAESFRTLRTNVEFAQVGDEPIRVVQITSSEASEGKSTVIANLAVALAKAGHSVLVVDLDLRRPVQHRMWSIPRAPGISDHLVGRATDVLAHIDEWNVDAVTAGNEPPESQRLLSSNNLADLVARWREEYEYVLLDTPPLLVADSLLISRLSDMVLFVVRPRTSRRASLRLAQQTHGRMSIVRGLVINGVVTRRGGYYHYYRGSYYGSRTTDTQET